MMDDKMMFLSNRVELSENTSNDNLMAKFILCDFGTNHNGVRINREKVESWVSTLVNQPFVGRIGYGGDFTGHNMRLSTITNSSGEEETQVVFDTEAIGTFVSAGIEEIDGTEYIVGSAEIWRRYPHVCNLIESRIKDGTLHTSWEILVSDYHIDGDVKVIDDGRFTALCALGKNVPPAYDSSRLLEVAESEEDVELIDAISGDVQTYKSKEDSNAMDNLETSAVEVVETEVSEMNEVSVEVVEETVAEAVETVDIEGSQVEAEAEVSEADAETEMIEEQTVEGAEATENADNTEVSEPEIASLTVTDIRAKIEGILWEKNRLDGYVEFMYPEDHTVLVRVCGKGFGDLNYMQYTYTVNGEEVSIDDGVKVRLEATPIAMSEMIASQNEALVEASQRIKGLEAEIAELKPFKEAAEKAQAEKEAIEKAQKIEALSDYAKKSGYITSEEIENDGEIKTMISELNESGIKQIIADRFMESLNKAPAVEVSSVAEEEPIATVNLLDGSDDADVSIISAYINK